MVPLLARRLTMSARGGGHAAPASRDRGPILPSTPLGAVIGKELRMYSRSVLRSVMLMISFLVGVLAAVIPAFSGKTTGLPFAGLLFTVIAAACFTNFYGDDGTALWLTLVTPGAARPDVRGRVWAWFLVTGPAGFLLTVVLTAVSGQAWSWPWVRPRPRTRPQDQRIRHRPAPHHAVAGRRAARSRHRHPRCGGALARRPRRPGLGCLSVLAFGPAGAAAAGEPRPGDLRPRPRPGELKTRGYYEFLSRAPTGLPLSNR